MRWRRVLALRVSKASGRESASERPRSCGRTHAARRDPRQWPTSGDARGQRDVVGAGGTLAARHAHRTDRGDDRVPAATRARERTARHRGRDVAHRSAGRPHRFRVRQPDKADWCLRRRGAGPRAGRCGRMESGVVVIYVRCGSMRVRWGRRPKPAAGSSKRPVAPWQSARSATPKLSCAAIAEPKSSKDHAPPYGDETADMAFRT
jgi:hypothetical protein